MTAGPLHPDNLTNGRDRDVTRGHGTRALGPSDTSESGSDLQGAPGLAGQDLCPLGVLGALAQHQDRLVGLDRADFEATDLHLARPRRLQRERVRRQVQDAPGEPIAIVQINGIGVCGSRGQAGERENQGGGTLQAEQARDASQQETQKPRVRHGGVL